MNKASSIKDHRVLPLDVDGQTVWIVRFKNDLFLKRAFDNEAELSEALGADDKAATVHVRTDPEAPWGVIEFLLNEEPLYAVYDSAKGNIVVEGSYNRQDAETTSDRLNGQFDEQSSPPEP
ncbi:MAG: hypothetical protein E5X15_18250 [Mesorhizobium sp.]|nr:MAG: hypothetical protein E5X15_18250 [Mesorhizobium sp.]